MFELFNSFNKKKSFFHQNPWGQDFISTSPQWAQTLTPSPLPALAAASPVVLNLSVAINYGEASMALVHVFKLPQMKCIGKTPLVERMSPPQLDSCFTTDGVGAGVSTGPLALSYLWSLEPRQVVLVLLAHTQLPSIEPCHYPGKSGQHAACINATNGMCSCSGEWPIKCN